MADSPAPDGIKPPVRLTRRLDSPTPTVADVYLIPQVESARRFKVDLTRWPKIMAIAAHCATLAAFADAAPARQPDAA